MLVQLVSGLVDLHTERNRGQQAQPGTAELDLEQAQFCVALLRVLEIASHIKRCGYRSLSIHARRQCPVAVAELM